tara:strand:+ start:40751 stop:41494 length:744 start_codon:yes stop_codon:yes gene_type:complete
MKNEVDSEPNRLGPDDAAEVLDLISTGYEPHVLAGSVYSSDKALAYLRDVICDNDNHFYGYFLGNELACVIHLKILEEWIHLNHIVTVDHYKGRGFASAMMSFVLRIANSYNKSVSLDVDSENGTVKSWYASFGFMDVDSEKKQLLTSDGHECDFLKKVSLDDNGPWSSYGVDFGRLQIDNFGLEIPVGLVSPCTFNINSAFLREGVADYILTQNRGCSIVAHGPDSLSDSEFFKKEWVAYRMVRKV